ncbi:hypothetical protein DJ010_17775 [Nocardioides silvaticus]|uniref:Uncharacterized protein n=1 Tax=Nocardioides silvaticus TaxID=2201891 RepID=A0A316TGX0_9ACTN|nr:hypothetical protein DJ010_17775 [Nocardioides silvaticus]
MTASRSVYHLNGLHDLVQFFEQLERDWRGWEGARTWRSLEGHLSIEARHESSRVQLRATLRHLDPSGDLEGWTASVDVSIDPGEQLSAVVQEVRALTAG